MKQSASDSTFFLYDLPCSSTRKAVGVTDFSMEIPSACGTRIKIEDCPAHNLAEAGGKNGSARLLVIERSDGFQLRIKTDPSMLLNEDKNGNISIYSLTNKIELKINRENGQNHIKGHSLHEAFVSGVANVLIDVKKIYSCTICGSGTMTVNSHSIFGSTFTAGCGNAVISAEHNISQSDIMGGQGKLSVIAWRDISESRIKIGSGGADIHAGHGIDKCGISGDEGAANIYAGFSISNSAIQTGEGNDSVYAGHIIENSAINTGNGNDVIYTNYLENSLLDSGGGDDFIVVRAAGSAVIQGGAGNGILWVGASNNTVINGGEGGNVIYSNRECDADEANVWVDTVDPKIRAEIERRNAIVRAGASAPEGSKAREAFNQLHSQQSRNEYDRMFKELQSAHSSYHKMLQCGLVERISRRSCPDLAMEIARRPYRLY